MKDVRDLLHEHIIPLVANKYFYNTRMVGLGLRVKIIQMSILSEDERVGL